jgi:hypothetical protein
MQTASYRVFISHASDDVGVAKLLSGYIEAAGAEYVLDARHLAGGDDFYGWMCSAITGCDELLVLLSPASLSSVNVGFELGIAAARNMWISPILHGIDKERLHDHPLGRGLLARKTLLTLEEFATYQSQLAGRITKAREDPYEYALRNAQSIVDTSLRKNREHA